MRAKTLNDLLKAGDKIAVSNITGREASTVTTISQKYCKNIVGGWALGKGGQKIEVPGGNSVPVFSTIEELVNILPQKMHPNKILVYSPPPAVNGEIKEIIEHCADTVETIFVVTEHVSIEVTAKIAQMCTQANIDVVGCNSLGMINTHDAVRIGAVGGNNPAESFRPGSALIISNSGNMVNTMASYLLSAGVGTSYGISTGKDLLILSSLKDILELARDDERTKLIVAYIEPGGFYEKEAMDMLLKKGYPKPIIVYIVGQFLGGTESALGHAGAVVEGKDTTAVTKAEMFDKYFGFGPFELDKKYTKTEKLADSLKKGIRITTLHHLPAAARLIYDTIGIERDFKPSKPLKLNPWFVNYRGLGKMLPSKFLLHQGTIPQPYASQIKLLSKESIGANLPKRNMRNASHVSSNDGKVTRIYGYSIENLMQQSSLAGAVLLSWLGENVRNFEVELFEKCLIAALTNGPGTISAQGAKLSASAGNSPNTAMIATLACIGNVHGGNGRRAINYLVNLFRDVDMDDPWDPAHNVNLAAMAKAEADRFSKERAAAKEAGTDYRRIPCLGHPVFKNKPVNFDPREQVVFKHLAEHGKCNIFLDFYHMLAQRMKEIGISRNVWAVNLDAAIASVVLGICWKPLKEKRITLQRVSDIAFMTFALGRVAGAGGEFLDHQDFGSPMDMRIPADEAVILTRPKD